MKKYIVTTTINPPTLATLKFSKMDGWDMIIVGDKKTPHASYKEVEATYLHPEEQESKYKELSDAIGWNNIQRRNIGYVEAYNLGADIIATVDDDNIPYDNWGKDVMVGQEIEVDLYTTPHGYFDPLSVTNSNQVWHRGYPLEFVPYRLVNVKYAGKTKRKVLVQADLWDGDPDIDAMARLSVNPTVKFSDITEPYCSDGISPFNSQNTFLAREVMPHYSVIPHVGRMDDIWGGYIMQHYFPGSVIYNKATVYQDRNEQDLITNLENEILGYRRTLELLEDLPNWRSILPPESLKFVEIYQNSLQTD